MLAVITGASGLVGGNLAVELLRQGHRVRATRRGGSRIAHLDAFSIEWVDADLSDRSALGRAFEGADAVFHCAALVSIRKTPTPALIAANIEGTRHVIDAVRHAGVRRLVHCSTVSAIGLSTDGQPCTEESPWNFVERGMADGYSATKHEAQLLVEAAAREGTDAVIVNPTFMFGPYDSRPSSGQMIVEVVRRRVPGVTFGMNNFVDVRDVARGMLLAWEKGRAGEKYILGGRNMSYAEIMRTIASVAGVAPPRFAIPKPIARIAGAVGDVAEWFSKKEPQLNRVTVDFGFCRDFIFSSDKAVRELGYGISPIEIAIRDAIAWFRERGMLPPAR